MRQDGSAVGNQRCAIFPDALVDGDVFQPNLDCFGDQPRANGFQTVPGGFVE
jgi:hypothetical protein